MTGFYKMFSFSPHPLSHLKIFFQINLLGYLKKSLYIRDTYLGEIESCNYPLSIRYLKLVCIQITSWGLKWRFFEKEIELKMKFKNEVKSIFILMLNLVLNCLWYCFILYDY